MARSDPTTPADPLDGVDSRKLAVELLAYARRRATRYGWRLVGDGALADGMRVEDVVQEAILSLYDGSRTWNRSQTPDVSVHLRSVVNSKLDHLATSFDNGHVEASGGMDDREGAPVTSPTPEALVLAKEWAGHRLRARNLFFERIVGDDQLIAVYEAMETLGDDKPALLAEHLKMPVATVNNTKKRIERRWREVYRDIAPSSESLRRSP